MSPQSRFRRSSMLSCLALLAACGGEQELAVDLPLTDFGRGILDAAFVQDWAAYEVAASSLRTTDIHYTSQDFDSWFGSSALSGNPLVQTGVEYAHAAGLTGAGRLVLVLDSGFKRDHEVFAGKTLTFQAGPGSVTDHGTATAGIIGGQSATFIGIAPGVDLQLDEFDTQNHMANASRLAYERGAIVQNNSWGYDDVFVNSSDFDTIFGDPEGQDYLNALREFSSDRLVVFSVSNDDTATRTALMEGLPRLVDGIEEGWLAVGNAIPFYTNSGVIADAEMFSADCMGAARWCLVANGQWPNLPSVFEYADNDPGHLNPIGAGNSAYIPWQGSSFAAPQVSGAIALLSEAFPTLTPHQLRVRLLASADNGFFHNAGVSAGTISNVDLSGGFFHEYSSVYGHGFLDIKAALLPIGTPIVTLADGSQFAADEPLAHSGSALGDAVQVSLADVDIDVRDALDGAFPLAADKLFAAATPRPLAAEILPSLRAAKVSLPTLTTARPLANSFAEQAGHTFDVSTPALDVAFLLPLADGRSASLGLTLGKSADLGELRLDYGLKMARDDGSLLGFAAGDSPSDLTNLAALSLGLSQENDASFWSLRGEAGIAEIGPVAGLRAIGVAHFNSLSAEIGRRGVFMAGDRLALRLGLPTTVSSGHAELDLPLAATRADNLPVAVNLAPTARQIDLSLTWNAEVAPDQFLTLGLTHVENHGNRNGLEDSAVMVGWSMRF